MFEKWTLEIGQSCRMVGTMTIKAAQAAFSLLQGEGSDLAQKQRTRY